MGSEQIVQDIPTGVLVRIASHALLLAKSIVLGDVEHRLGRRPPAGLRFLGAVLSGLLWTVYGVSGMAMRRQTRAAVNVAAFGTSLMLLFIGGFWATSIWWVGENGRNVFHPVWFGVFILIPLAILAGQYVYFRHFTRRHPARAHWRFASNAVLGAAIVLSVIGGYLLGHYAWIGAVFSDLVAGLRSRWTLVFLIAPIALAGLLVLARRLTRAPEP